MSRLRQNELKQMNPSELQQKIAELRKELMKLNAQIASGTTPKSPGHVRIIKKNIARIMQYLHGGKTNT